MANIFKALKKYLIYTEQEYQEEFILKETKAERASARGKPVKAAEGSPKGNRSKGKKTGTSGDGLKKPVPISKDNAGRKGDEKDKKDGNEEQDKNSGGGGHQSEISRNLSDNLEYMKKVYSIPTNGDVMLREFDIITKEGPVAAFIIFIDGMTDRTVINLNILQPLMLLSNLDIKSKEDDIGRYVKKHLLVHNQIKIASEYTTVIEEVNFGGCGIFIDGVGKAFAADVKGWEHRGVERPNTELVIRGPQEGFTEVLRVNTALIRKILKDEDLISENIQIGRRSKTPCAMLYIKDIANDSLVQEVRRRLDNIKIDYLLDSGELEQLIEDRTFLPSPQITATERPDRAAALLAEGKVAIVMHGSPFCLIVPTTTVDLFKTTEDNYIRFPLASFSRIIRYIGVFFSLLLPGLYVAITNFHHEMIPTDLLLAIEASREKVPFPSIIEILMMEIAFELIREAGIRIPGPIGPTLGIIGALILGQAAVAANIVSPILIIVVAVTGIGSFAIPNFSLAFSFRLLRFVYIILGSMVGFLGITTGLFIHGLFLVSTKSFGVPFMAPIGPKTKGALDDDLLKAPIWKLERRPDFLNVKDEYRQPKISRRWRYKDSRDRNKQER